MIGVIPVAKDRFTPEAFPILFSDNAPDVGGAYATGGAALRFLCLGECG